MQSYVQKERTNVLLRDYPNFSDMHGYPNKPISMYCNSHLVPVLGKIKKKKCIIRCCALRRFFCFITPTLVAKNESETPAIMSPFWRNFPVFFQIVAFSEWKKKDIGQVKNEQDIVWGRFRHNVARQVNFSLRHAYIVVSIVFLQLTSTDAHGTKAVQSFGC